MSVRQRFQRLVIAVLFTPFIPHPSVQWSTPWPPAFLWLGFALISGDTMPFELFTISGAAIILAIAGFRCLPLRHLGKALLTIDALVGYLCASFIHSNQRLSTRAWRY